MSKLAIIIVNYGTPNLVVECLASIANDAQSRHLSVWVVDNSSPDDSVRFIRDAIHRNSWQEWSTLLPLTANNGFAAGTNIGLDAALASDVRPDYVLLLNPDTIVCPHAILHLADFMDRHPKVGIVGSRLESPDGTPQCSSFRFPSVLSELENGLRLSIITRALERFVVAIPPSNNAHPADWVSGASMMIRREVIEQVGVFDASFFLYFEEVDFCRRARRAGWPCWYVPESRVVHYGGQSTAGATGERSQQPAYQYWLASRQLYFDKHHSRAAHCIADLCWAGGYLLWRIRRRWQSKPDTDPPSLLREFLRRSTWFSSLRSR